METTNPFARLARLSGALPTADRVYVDSVTNLITVCHYILGSKTYSITFDRQYETSESPTKAPGRKLKSFRLNFICEYPQSIGNEEKEEIDLKLIHELKNRLGDKYFQLLISSHGGTDSGTYVIDLSLKGLQKLNPALKTHEKVLRHETAEQKEIRERELAFRKVGAAERQVSQLESEFGNITSQEYFAHLSALYKASKIKLVDAKGQNELSGMSSNDLPIPLQIKENLRAMYLIFLRFKEAVTSDSEFQHSLFQMFPNKTIDNIMEDPGRRIECFIRYIERNSDLQNTLKEIFNSVDPEVNKVKFEGYQVCSESIEKYSQHNESMMMLSGKMGDALIHCYAFIEAEEKKYTEPMGRLMDASHFLLGYPQLQYEPQFEHVDSASKTFNGPLTSIQLAVVPCKNGAIRSENDFDDFVGKLKNLLGEDRFNRLVLSTEIIKSTKGDDEKYCLYLNPTELQTIIMSDLVHDLSPDDLAMYSLMCREKAISAAILYQIDPIAQMYKDFVAMYEIYAKFKMATLSTDTRVSFISDPDFFEGQKHTSEISHFTNFVQFIRKNEHYLTTVMQIFSRDQVEVSRIKCEKYVKHCESIAKFTYGNELKRTWFSSFGELVKYFATIANALHLLKLTYPQLLPLLVAGKNMNISNEIIYEVFKNLYALNEAEKNLINNGNQNPAFEAARDSHKIG
jgi:hypothetical protein